ncbi:MAG: ankyrin repeat domain-containing protein [Candidatus Gastranaerophilaceae bacterium]
MKKKIFAVTMAVTCAVSANAGELTDEMFGEMLRNIPPAETMLRKTPEKGDVTDVAEQMILRETEKLHNAQMSKKEAKAAKKAEKKAAKEAKKSEKLAEEAEKTAREALTQSKEIVKSLKSEKKAFRKELKARKIKFSEEEFLSFVKQGNFELTEIFLKAGIDPNAADSAGNTALLWASYNGNSKIAGELVSRGADVRRVNTDGFSALHAAVESGNTEVAKMLIDGGADVNAAVPRDNTTALHTACYKGDAKTAKLLIQHGADFNAKNVHGATPLVTACFYGHSELVPILTEAGADVDLNDEKTPLKAALQKGNTELYEFLVKNGGDIDTKDENGKTLLFSAIEKDDVETVKFLVENGADVNLVVKGVAPILEAVARKNFDTVKFLVEKGADLSVKMPENDVNALQTAMLSDSDEIANFLLSRVNLNEKNKYGLTAADIALAAKNEELLEQIDVLGGLHGLPIGETLVKYGCSINYDEEKNLYRITAKDALKAAKKAESDEKIKAPYDDYMKKTASYRAQREFTTDKHAFRVYPLLFGIAQ